MARAKGACMTRIDLASMLHATSPAATRPDAGADGDAWQREMERAQMAEWFAHGPLVFKPAMRMPPGDAAAQPAALAIDSIPAAIAPSPGNQVEAPRSQQLQTQSVTAPRAHPLRSPSHAPVFNLQREVLTPGGSPATAAGEYAHRPVNAQDPQSVSTEAAPRAAAGGTPTNQASRAFDLHARLRAQLAPVVELGPMVAASPSSGWVGPQPVIDRAPAAAHPGAASQFIGAAPTAASVFPLPGAPPAVTNPVTMAATIPVTSTGQDDAHPVAATPRSRTHPAQAPDASPVRATAYWQGEDGVHLWIGADTDALEEMGPVLRRVETFLRSQGVRLLGITCNGRRWLGPSVPISFQEER